MVAFKQLTGHWMRGHVPGISWQKGFFDRVLRRSQDIVGMLRYCADNPVRAGLVEHWQEYAFTGSDVYDLRDLFGAA
jgi:hypothetical protein